MHCVILVTTKDKKEAEKIAARLLEEKLIACANIIEGVNSLFRWEGKVDQAQETLIVIKSSRKLFAKIAKTVKKMHSYNVPEIIALPIISGYNPYLKWIEASTKKG